MKRGVSKKLVADTLLAQGPMFVHFDARQPGVFVPPHLDGHHYVAVHVGYDMPLPIDDLLVTDEEISGTLHFREHGFYTCHIPLSAVFAMINQDGRGVVWDRPELSARPSLRVVK